MTTIKMIVGLGNPGQKYANNRHNIGFMALDRIASDHGFGPWRAKFQSQISEGRLGEEKIILVKPETYMNKSGHAVAEAMGYFKFDSKQIVVFHDEIDLAPGKLKAKSGGGHAGHNGLRSIQAHIGPDFLRVRMGVGHPGHKDAVPTYVLRDFPKTDAEWLDRMLRGISDGTNALVQGDVPRFLNAVALELTPPRSSKKPATSEPGTPSSRPAPAQDKRSPLERLVAKFK